MGREVLRVGICQRYNHNLIIRYFFRCEARTTLSSGCHTKRNRKSSCEDALELQFVDLDLILYIYVVFTFRTIALDLAATAPTISRFLHARLTMTLSGGFSGALVLSQRAPCFPA